MIQFEVILRNAVNERLILDFGINWYNGEKISFAPKQKDLINSIQLDLKNQSKPINSCNIVSGLTFGFWVNLFNPEYDKTIWRQSLASSFKKNGKIPKRALIRERLKNFHKLRNRISHCEPIVQFPLDKYYLQLIEFISWMSQELADWLEGEIEFNSIQKYQNNEKIND